MLNYYFSNNLDSKINKKIDSVRNAIMQYKNKIFLSGFTINEAQALVDAMISDYPEIYNCAINVVSYNVSPVGIELLFTYFTLDVGTFNTEVSKIRQKLDEMIPYNASEYERAKIIYEFLARHINSKDYEAQEVYATIDPNNREQVMDFIGRFGESFNLYGAIVNQKATCMGMSLAYKYLLNLYGVEATCIPGTSEVNFADGTVDESRHMITAVEIDGKFAYVDLTRAKADNFDMIFYDYFLVDNEIIADYFVPDVSLECAKELNYFVKNKVQFKTLAPLRNYLFSYIYDSTQGEIRFSYRGKEVDDKYLEKIILNTVGAHLGDEFEFVGRIISKGFANCIIKKK